MPGLHAQDGEGWRGVMISGCASTAMRAEFGGVVLVQLGLACGTFTYLARHTVAIGMHSFG